MNIYIATNFNNWQPFGVPFTSKRQALERFALHAELSNKDTVYRLSHYEHRHNYDKQGDELLEWQQDECITPAEAKIKLEAYK